MCRAADAVPNGPGWIDRLAWAREVPITEGDVDPSGGSRAPSPPEFGEKLPLTHVMSFFGRAKTLRDTDTAGTRAYGTREGERREQLRLLNA